MKKSKTHILFFVLPLGVVVMAFFLFMRHSDWDLNNELEYITPPWEISVERMIGEPVAYLAEKGEKDLRNVLERLFKNPTILYMELLKNGGSLYRASRFPEPWPEIDAGGLPKLSVIKTDLTKLLVMKTRFNGQSQGHYTLLVGFDYASLDATTTRFFRRIHRKIFMFVVGVLFIIVIQKYYSGKFYRKEMELEKEKQEKERFKKFSLLTSEIAHEIKNPLNSIYLSFKTLEKHISVSPGKEKQAEFYKSAIKNEIQRVSEILQSYFQLSGDIRPLIEKTDIRQFVGEFKFLVEKELHDNRIDFKIELPEAFTINTDRNLVKQILLNFIKNSAEAGARNITVRFFTEAKTLTVEIADDGKGIDKAIEEKIFKPYFSTKTRGMGLGLHITLRLVKALGGELSLPASSPGNTVFKISIPEPIRTNGGKNA